MRSEKAEKEMRINLTNLKYLNRVLKLVQQLQVLHLNCIEIVVFRPYKLHHQ